MWRQLPSVAGAQDHEPCPPVAPQWRVVGYALREQKTHDPVHVLDPLSDQGLPLPAKPPAIFLLGRRHRHHGADPRLAPLVGQKRSQQRLAIQPVRLGPPLPARRRDRSGIDHVALDPLLLQNAVQPEPVQTRLLDCDDRIAQAGPDLRLAIELCEQLHQLSNIVRLDAVPGHLLALAGRQRRDQPRRTAQFQRHKNCAKLRADSGRSVGKMIEQHRRLQVGWLCNPSLASDSGAIHSSWNLRCARNDGTRWLWWRPQQRRGYPMQYRQLGRSGLKVSPICLGSMMFGGPTDEAASQRIIAKAHEAGINFIDTADAYSQGGS